MNRTADQRTASDSSASESSRDTVGKTGGGPRHCPLVGIGASAGGIEALIRLFDAMPPDSGMAFVVVMHLDPTRVSGLADVLGQHTKMTVGEAVDGVAVEPDHIYVIPPATSLTVEEGHLRLSEPVERRGARYPIDRLFESMATHRRGRAICIVLSGSGTDGTGGLREVKAEGGCVLVQSPSTAKFDSMPQSVIMADLADHVLAPENMPEILLRYVKHAYSAGAELFADGPSRDVSITPVLALLRSRADHDFRLYKRSTLTRRIHRRMGLCNLHSVEDYLDYLRSQPGELETLARDLMINVTTFFRDPEAWAALDESVLAALVAERETGAAIRLWVPACATGEEAYTLAMLLVDRAEAAGKRFDIKLFATDSREDNLTIARAGLYSEGAIAAIPPHLFERHFDMLGENCRVKEELRDMVVFAAHNLLRDPPFSQIDVVTCRNLLIYFETAAQKRALALMHFSLRQGGYMMLGNAESVSGREDLFDTISKKWRIFRRLGPNRHDILDFPLFPGRSRPGAADGAAAPEASRLPPRIVDVAQRALLERFAPASVLIGRNGEVVWVHGSTGAYLEPPPGEPSRDILAMARHGLRAKLRHAVRDAIAENRPVEFRVRIRRDHHEQPVAVAVVPLSEQSDALLLVSFRDIGPEQTIPATADETDRMVTQQAVEFELVAARIELRETVEQFERTNEELKVANEEVTSMNEELQSTNEELETSKEELQSFNEELQTVNSQLQHKNQELADTTDTLNNLLASSEIATVFLDRNFCIRWFSPSSKGLLALVDTDIGRPVTHFAWKVEDDALLPDARLVLQKLTGIDAEVRGSAGRWYLRRVLPYRTHDDRIAGVVIAFVDITERKLAQDAIKEALDYAEAIINTVRHPVMVLDAELRVQSINPAFCEAFSCPPDESNGYQLHELDHGAWDIPELRRLLREVLSEAQAFDDFEIEHVFPKRGRRHMRLNARRLVHGGDRTKLILLAIEDVTANHEAEGLRQTLISELSHRVKNTLAMVQSIGSQTIRQSATLDEFRIAFEGRLTALARVHDLLLRQNWDGADLDQLVRETLAPHGRKDRIRAEGPTLTMTPDAGVVLAMVLNELATNAVKYGALSEGDGRLDIRWELQTRADGDWVCLTWTETGGPAVAAPSRRGFGSSLIERSITHQLGGTAELDFRAEGLQCDIAFPRKIDQRPPGRKET
ncbi:chemotaxis protein CheB [Paragemmobacter aquarius]|uniref:chemotaxis protein CheB n=1 Tax=Paragemmobacter aquarius TaxID=2169400 RepID=UPI00131EF887|nr:chemotaxis protein CheB [Gemmobacter aquarius]